MTQLKQLIKFFGYYITTLINFFIPKNNKYIYVFDPFYKKDNSFAFAKYVSENSDEYRIIYYSKKTPKFKNKKFKYIDSFFIGLWYQFRSRIIIYSYRGDGYIPFKSFRNQKIIDTMHGSPLKAIGYGANHRSSLLDIRYEQTFDYILCQSEFFKDVIKLRFGANDDQCIITGYPRNDMIFSNKNFLKLYFGDNDYKKTVLWMPTWRNPIKGDSGITVESYSFPILNESNISELNIKLQELKLLLVIKPHPFQKRLPLFNNRVSNILILDNDNLEINDIELYETLNSFDALITDYSSIYFDFLLTDKPLAFTVDDLDLYSDYHGFSFEEPKKLMPGFEIENIVNLYEFLDNIANGIDEYSKRRKEVNKIVNKYQDANSSKRLSSFLEVNINEK